MAEDFAHENCGLVVAKLWDMFPNLEVERLSGIVNDGRNGPFCYRDHLDSNSEADCEACAVWTQNCVMAVLNGNSVEAASPGVDVAERHAVIDNPGHDHSGDYLNSNSDEDGFINHLVDLSNDSLDSLDVLGSEDEGDARHRTNVWEYSEERGAAAGGGIAEEEADDLNATPVLEDLVDQVIELSEHGGVAARAPAAAHVVVVGDAGSPAAIRVEEVAEGERSLSPPVQAPPPPATPAVAPPHHTHVAAGDGAIGAAAAAGSSGWKPLDPLSTAKIEITDIFPDVDQDYLAKQLDEIQRSGMTGAEQTLTTIAVDRFMERGYTKKLKKKPIINMKSVTVTESEKSAHSKSSAAPVWLDMQASTGCCNNYGDAKRQLQHDFRQVSCAAFDRLLGELGKRYAPTYFVLAHSWIQQFGDLANLGPPQGTFNVKCTVAEFDINVGFDTKLLKSRRPMTHLNSVTSKQIAKERQSALDYLYKGLATATASPGVGADNTAAASAPPDAAIGATNSAAASAEFDDDECLIECEICYNEVKIEKMVQCPDAHLFCFDCVRNYVKESVYGGYASAHIKCLDGECEQHFQTSQLRRCLDDALLDKYLERQQEECLNTAQLENLVRCPNCNCPAVVPPESKVLECQNTDCGMSTCRYCRVDWDEHIGIPCKEIEQNDETKIRLKFEEKMSEAKIRRCHKCKVQLVKSEGCNKMTCRCGAKMCYCCRAAIQCYSHFCQHMRNPGEGCHTCNKCFLWSKAEEDDARAISEIKEEANRKRKEEGYLEEKEIGAPSPSKKKKK